MNEWQPIETAPKDGTEVYTGIMNSVGFVHYPTRSKFLNGEWCAWFGPMLEWGPYEPQPTHWMPLPEPPK